MKTSAEHLEGEELIGGWIEALNHCLITENYGTECDPDQLEELACSSLELLRRRNPSAFQRLFGSAGMTPEGLCWRDRCVANDKRVREALRLLRVRGDLSSQRFEQVCKLLENSLQPVPSENFPEVGR